MIQRWLLPLLLLLAVLPYPVLALDPPTAPVALRTAILPDQPNQPFYIWSDDGTAMEYQIEVYDAASNLIFSDTVAVGLHCAIGEQCTVQQPTPLARGFYAWKVRANGWDESGYSDWSNVYTFYQSEFAPPIFEPVPSPTPVPTEAATTPEPVAGLPLNSLYNALATAYVTLNEAPDDPSQNNGLPILPALQQLPTVFGYARWLFSSSTTDALFGPFSAAMIHTAAFFVVLFVLTNISLILFIVRFIIRFVVWVYTQITKLIP